MNSKEIWNLWTEGMRPKIIIICYFEINKKINQINSRSIFWNYNKVCMKESMSIQFNVGNVSKGM